MTDLVVERLRAAAPPGVARAAAETLLHPALDLARDRRVLIVRRLRVDPSDPDAARAALLSLRGRAVRPGDPTAADAPALLFDDLVEALAAFTRDLTDGVAGDRWYWTSWLRRARGHGGTPLYGAWREHLPWLPAALRELAATTPEVAGRALALLDPAERQAFGAVLPPEPDPPVTVRGRGNRAGAALRAAAATLVRHEGGGPFRATRRAPATAAPPESRPPATSRSPARRPHPTRARGAVALVRSDRPSPLDAPAWGRLQGRGPGRSPTPQAPDGGSPPRRGGPARLRIGTPARRGQSPSRTHRVPRPVGAPPRTPRGPARRAGVRRRATPVPPSSRWPEGVATRHAAAVQLLHLVLRFGGEDAGAADLSRFAQWVLRDRPRRGRRRRDPLWALLAALDEAPAPALRRRPAWWDAAAGFLADAGLTPASFERPGLVAVTRTHLDVVLGLEEIDLGVRLAGLDQDLGWVPRLGRVVCFHFEGA